MKARPFLSALIAVLLSLLLLTFGVLWALDRRSPLRLTEASPDLPRAARFVPRRAALSLHWLADPSRLPAYVQAVAPASERRQARDAARRWREGVFALAGLDYDSELASWLGSDVSLTLLDADGSRSDPGWILALSSRSSDGARLFLQRFWQTRSLAGTDLQVSSYRGMGLISGRGAVQGRAPVPLATTLIDDDLLLLASGRGVLEQALDVSQLQDQHQLGDVQLQRQLQELGDGVALMTVSPAALQQWFQLPAALADRPDLEGLVARLHPDGRDLAVDGLLRFRGPLDSASWEPADRLIPAAAGRPAWLAQLQDPGRLIRADDDHPLVQWVGPLLRNVLVDHPVAGQIARLDDGPLLWLQQAESWLLATRPGHPPRSSLNERLQAEGLARSELSGDGETLQVWTRLVRQRGRGEGLDAQLAVASAGDADLDWWGDSLAALDRRRDSRGISDRQNQWRSLQGSEAASQSLLLADQPARSLLSRWYPWRLVQALSGDPLQARVQGLALALERDHDDGDSSVLPLHARLELG